MGEGIQRWGAGVSPAEDDGQDARPPMKCWRRGKVGEEPPFVPPLVRGEDASIACRVQVSAGRVQVSAGQESGQADRLT